MSIVSRTQTVVRHRSALAVLLLSLGLVGCSPRPDDMAATVSTPDDYHLRHPIVLSEEPNTLDVFLAGNSGRIDQRQVEDIRHFAVDYRNKGQGPIRAAIPNIPDQASVRATLESVKRQLASVGVRGSIAVGSYDVADMHLASPIRLSFREVQASVPSTCGQWPEDLASGSSFDGMRNKTYSNFGCATQTDLAMQVADPRDLVRPRTESQSDSTMRLRAIGNIQQGIDPGTNWMTNNTAISTVGAN